MSRNRKRRRPLLIPLASMGDIAFLLIIFFMICSRFAQDPEGPLSLPVNPQITKLEEGGLRVSIDATGIIRVQGIRTDTPASVGAAVSAWLAPIPADHRKAVIFQCDRNVDKSVFEPVLDAISHAGGIIAAVGERTSPPSDKEHP